MSDDQSEDRGASVATKILGALLVVGAGKDRICRTPETKALARRMPQADYVEIPEAEHEILMERNPIRTEFWAAFDGFMRDRWCIKNHAPA